MKGLQTIKNAGKRSAKFVASNAKALGIVAAFIAGTSALIGSGVYGARKIFTGETVFRGQLGDSFVVYKEGIADGLFGTKNVMEVQRNGMIYTLIDSEAPVSLKDYGVSTSALESDSSSREPMLRVATIEHIASRGQGNSFSLDLQGPQHKVYGWKAPEAFSEADRFYSATQKRIAEKICKDFDAAFTGLR